MIQASNYQRREWEHISALFTKMKHADNLTHKGHFQSFQFNSRRRGGGERIIVLTVHVVSVHHICENGNTALCIQIPTAALCLCFVLGFFFLFVSNGIKM